MVCYKIQIVKFLAWKVNTIISIVRTQLFLQRIFSLTWVKVLHLILLHPPPRVVCSDTNHCHASPCTPISFSTACPHQHGQKCVSSFYLVTCFCHPLAVPWWGAEVRATAGKNLMSTRHKGSSFLFK
jgi:hypothetical protein